MYYIPQQRHTTGGLLHAQCLHVLVHTSIKAAVVMTGYLWHVLTQIRMLCVQVADFLFGSAALPHDFLHEPLLRILATGFAGASTAAASLNVSHP